MNIVHHNHIEVVGNIRYGALVCCCEPPYGTFYRGSIAVERLSGTVDLLPVTIPENVYNAALRDDWHLVNRLRLMGEIRTYNKPVDGRYRHIVMLYVHMIEPADSQDKNHAHLTGNICKPPIYRLTPFGRKISDFILAVNRGNGKTDYIPCIAWGANAMAAREWKVGDTVELIGRYQSRDYDKLLPDGSHETRTAYEVSASKIIKKEG